MSSRGDGQRPINHDGAAATPSRVERFVARWLFHFGIVGRGVKRPLGLWISLGTDFTGNVNRPFINVTLFGRYRGRVYMKELR